MLVITHLWSVLPWLLTLGGVLCLLVALKRPSHQRLWLEDYACLPHYQRHGQHISLHNVRANRYGAPGTPYASVYTTQHYDLSSLQRLWFAVESFSDYEAVAHTFFSFEWQDGRCLVLSIEARRQQGQVYSLWLGMLRHFEMIYSFGLESDFIVRRSLYQQHQLYLYPLKMDQAAVQALLRNLLEDSQDLLQRPLFYHTLYRSCTSEAIRHLQAVLPAHQARVLRWHPGHYIPGYADRMLRRAGLLPNDVPLETMRARYSVYERCQIAKQYEADDILFSQTLRRDVAPS